MIKIHLGIQVLKNLKIRGFLTEKVKKKFDKRWFFTGTFVSHVALCFRHNFFFFFCSHSSCAIPSSKVSSSIFEPHVVKKGLTHDIGSYKLNLAV